jgi:hypothetical protein
LVIYSPHGRDLLTLFERRFEAEHPDVDVRWIDMGSPDVYDRVGLSAPTRRPTSGQVGPGHSPAARDRCSRHRPNWPTRLGCARSRCGRLPFRSLRTPVSPFYAERGVPAPRAAGPGRPP